MRVTITENNYDLQYFNHAALASGTVGDVWIEDASEEREHGAAAKPKREVQRDH